MTENPRDKLKGVLERARERQVTLAHSRKGPPEPSVVEQIEHGTVAALVASVARLHTVLEDVERLLVSINMDLIIATDAFLKVQEQGERNAEVLEVLKTATSGKPPKWLLTLLGGIATVAGVAVLGWQTAAEMVRGAKQWLAGG